MKHIYLTLALLLAGGTAFARITGTNPTGASADAFCVGASGAEACVDSAGSVIPTTDNDADLGTSSLEWKDLYIDGTANIDSLAADAATFTGDVALSGAEVQVSSNTTTGISANFVGAFETAELDSLAGSVGDIAFNVTLFSLCASTATTDAAGAWVLMLSTATAQSSRVPCDNS